MDEEEYDAATINPFGGANSAAQESRRRREEARRRREAEEETRSRGVVTTQGGGGVTTSRAREIDDFSDGQAPTFEEYNQAGKRQGKNQAQIRRDYERALNQYEASLLELEDRMPTVDEMSYEASLEEGDFSLGPSAAGQAMAEQGSIDAQRRALGRMEDIYTQGGYTDLEREQIGQAMQQARDLERAGTMAARQQAAARGMTGSGAQMAAQLAAQQGAMNRGRSAATDIAMAGQQRALQALQGAGRTAGEMRGQSFEEGFRRGSAIDDFARDDMDYRRAKEMRRADRETDARRRRGEAAQQSYENLAQNRRDRVQQSQTGRQAYTATEGRLDADRMSKWNAFANMVGAGVDAGTGIAGAVKGGGQSS